MKIRKDIEKQLEQTEIILMSNDENAFFTGWRVESNAQLARDWERLIRGIASRENINNQQQNRSYERNV